MIESIFIEGFIYGIMVLGVFVTFRVLNFCDMTVDGSFPLGGCVLATCLMHGLNPFLALLIAFCAGLVAGFLTTTIYTYLKIPDLLSGILVMTMLYSINLRITGGVANISFLKIPTLFTGVTNFAKSILPSISYDMVIVLFMLIVTLGIKFLLDAFFTTDLGLTMGALGSNAQMVISQGVDPKALRYIGICLGNGFASLAGAFVSMYNGFADVSSGTGIVVSGLASLMLGEFLLKSNKIALQTLRIILGSLLYRALMVLGRRYGYYIGMTSNDLKLITGILIIICLIISKYNISDFLKKHLVHQDLHQDKSILAQKTAQNGDAK